MKDQLNIPATISVGFQKRQDTYTGKLAYVVYTDQKGVLRKEASWSKWRDKSIDVQTFDNTPTSGFVLNKKVGDYRGGWDGRKAWVRIYDPRDFEFEISIANLLFILEEASSIKGKGLEGEFVYSWDGSDLVLLPVASVDYKESSGFTALQTKKVGKKDVVPGCLYKNKANEEVMYLGRMPFIETLTTYEHTADGYRYITKTKETKLHIFVSMDGKSTYWTQDGFTKLAERLSTEVSPLFPDEFDKFKKSIHGSKPKNLVFKPNQNPLHEWGEEVRYQKVENRYYCIILRRDFQNKERILIARAASPVLEKDDCVQIPRPRYYPSGTIVSTSLDFHDLYLENEHGSSVKI